jgi:sulfonate transport system permease protein
MPSLARVLEAIRKPAGRFALPAAILIFWEAICTLGLVKPYLLPPPSEVVATTWALLINGQLPLHIAASALRVLEGFALAAAVGLGLGIAVGLYRPIATTFDLLIQLVKPVPPLAWIPLAILWFGIDEGAKIFVIFLGALFPILVNTVDAIRQTDARYVELAKVLELPQRRFVRDIVLKGALPQIMTGLRLGVTLAWMVVVAAELIAASRGVGYMIMDARQMSQADVVIAGMLTLGIVGKLTDDGLRVAERRLVRWRSSFSGM